MLSFFLFLLSTPHITLSIRAVAYVGPTRRPPPRSLRRRDLASPVCIQVVDKTSRIGQCPPRPAVLARGPAGMAKAASVVLLSRPAGMASEATSSARPIELHRLIGGRAAQSRQGAERIDRGIS